MANVGWADTPTRHAQETLHTAQQVRVSVEFDNARLLEGEVTTVGVLPGTHGGAPHLMEVSWALEAMDATRTVNATGVISMRHLAGPHSGAPNRRQAPGDLSTGGALRAEGTALLIAYPMPTASSPLIWLSTRQCRRKSPASQQGFPGFLDFRLHFSHR